MRGKDSNLRPPAYEAGELPVLYPAMFMLQRYKLFFEFTNYLSKKFLKNYKGIRKVK